MNQWQGKNGGSNAALHDALYEQISSSGDEAIKVALGLVDEADKAAYRAVHIRANKRIFRMEGRASG